MPNYVVGGRASICTWSLYAEFLTKEQAVGAVTDLLAEEICFNVSFRMELTESREKFVVEIEDFAWADNLLTVATILKKWDHEA